MIFLVTKPKRLPKQTPIGPAMANPATPPKAAHATRLKKLKNFLLFFFILFSFLFKKF
jgi:hypothetical protein